MDRVSSIAANRFFLKGGISGEQINAMNWSDNPLGPPDQWPQSLKSAVSMILHSAYPMFIWWGPEEINIHNDAYIPLMGDKSSTAMGKRAKDLWSEIWEKELVPLKAQVLNEGNSVYGKDLKLFLHRKGYPEECYFNFSYSPIMNEEGNIGGLFCACHEETEEFIRRRRSNLLKELNGIGRTSDIRPETLVASYIDAISKSPDDIPFAAVYLSSDGQHLNFIEGLNITGNRSSFPSQFEIDNPDDLWSAAKVYQSKTPLVVPITLDGLSSSSAAVVPIVHPSLDGEARGVLVIGISPHLAFDHDYNLFTIELAQQLYALLHDNAQKREMNNSVELFKNMADTIPAIIWITNIKGAYTYLNQPWYTYTGAEQFSMYKDDWHFYIHEDDREAALKNIIEAHATRTPFNLVYRIRNKIGKYSWFLNIGQPRINSAGQYEGFNGSMINIDEQQLVKENSARLASIVQTSDYAIVSETLAGIILSWNEGAERIYGYKANQMIGETYEKWVPQEKRAELLAIIEKIKAGGRVDYLETTRFNSKGEQIDISISVNPLLNESGELVGVSKISREITEIKRQTAAIYESEKKFRDLVKQAPVAIAVLMGPNFIAESANDKYLEIVDRSYDEFVGKKLFDSLPEVKEFVGPVLNNLMQTGETYYGKEFKLLLNRKGTQEVVYFDFVYQALKQNDGSVYGVMAIANEVTDKVEVRRHLEDAEERLRMAAQGTGLATWDLNLSTRDLIYSPRLSEIFGLPAEHRITQSYLRELIYTEDIPILEAAFHTALSSGIYDYQARVLKPDGTTVWITTRGRIIFENDQPQRMLGTTRDITDEKNAERRLQESEERFRTIANTAPVMIWMSGNDRFEDFFNTSWLQFTGRPLWKEMNNGWLDAVHTEDQIKIIDTYNGAFQKGESFYAEYRLLHNDGEYRWISDNAIPRYGSDGKFIGFISACMDIDAQKKGEIRKNEFLAVASHELKTPLTSIKAYAQLLNKTYSASDDEFLKNALSKVGNQVNKMTKLVGDFLNLSKIESDKFQLNKESFNIEELVREVVSELQMVSANHEILIDAAGELKIYADKEKIAQVITNLLNNAVKYSPQHKKIKIVLQLHMNDAKISVTDHGIGINKEEHGRIFERFYRSEFNNNISFSGFGIGLYISSEIVKSHGGIIGVDSEEGIGSTFYFTVPASDQ